MIIFTNFLSAPLSVVQNQETVLIFHSTGHVHGSSPVLALCCCQACPSGFHENKPRRNYFIEVCVNIDLKLDSVSAHLEQAIDGRDILSEMSVCSPPTLSCLNRNCDHCGAENAEKHIKQNLTCASTASVKWQSWDLVKKENGQKKERVEHEGTITDLVKILMKDLTTYSSMSLSTDGSFSNTRLFWPSYHPCSRLLLWCVTSLRITCAATRMKFTRHTGVIIK